jgi:PKD repeat protein
VALVAAVALLTFGAASRNFGIIAGVADYPGAIPDLEYTDDDAIAMWETLTCDPEWAAGDVTLLLDGAATKAGVVHAIQEISLLIVEGDTLLFYFSGHGTVGPDVPPLDEADGKDEYLCLYGSTLSEFLSDDELESLLASCAGADMVIALDTCYSGGQLSSVRSINTGPAPREADGFAADLSRLTRSAVIGPQDLGEVGSPLVALSACGEAELAWELGPPMSHGLFTAYLLEAMGGGADDTGDGNGRVAAEECFNYLVPRVAAVSNTYHLNQHPAMLDLHDGNLDFLRDLSDGPTAGFTANPLQATAPAAVECDASSSGASAGHVLTSFVWDFGDGTMETLSSPASVSHTYVTALESEEFEVVLTVVDDAGLLDTARATVTVTNCQPVAGFEWRASGDPAAWEVGDLSVLSDASSVVIELRSLAPEYPPSGSADLPLPCESVPANYADRNLSYDPEGQGVSGDGWGVVRYEIDFGDGTPVSVPADPLDGHLDALSHSYAVVTDVVSFIVTVRAFDELGGEGAWSRTLTLRRDDECRTQCMDLSDPGWHMIALPGELCGACGGAVGGLCCALCDDLDPCFIFHYDPTSGGYLMVPPCDAIDASVGMGLWVYVSDATTLCVPVTAPTETACIPMQAGWNQVGNPFDFEVLLSNTRIRYQGAEVTLEQAQGNGWISMYLFGYDAVSRGYAMVVPPNGMLEPMTGYWLRAYVDCELCIDPIPAPPVPPSGVRRADLTTLFAQGIPTPPAPPMMRAMAVSILDGLVVGNEPNPIRSENTTTFKVTGPKSDLVGAIRVEIYDLSGQLVWSEEIEAKELAWHTVNDAGELLANGVYLYRVWAKTGEIWYPLEIRKLAVVR